MDFFKTVKEFHKTGNTENGQIGGDPDVGI